MNGITNWLMPFTMGKNTYFGVYPANSTDAKTTTLTAQISATDTTIPVTSTAGYINNFGKLTIGSEVIMYEYKDATNFYGCLRGDEMTTAAIHLNNATVTQNNLILFYSRLPEVFSAEIDNSISAGTLAHNLEPCDEHMEGIIKMTAYNLLCKINPERAQQYKGDAIILYGEYAKDIAKGYASNRQNINVRDPYWSENGTPTMDFSR